jgi:hypothetical protein
VRAVEIDAERARPAARVTRSLSEVPAAGLWRRDGLAHCSWTATCDRLVQVPRCREGVSMKSPAVSVDGYVAQVEGDRRPVVERLRSACRERFEGYDEVMAYGMPTYQLEGRSEVGFARQGRYLPPPSPRRRCPTPTGQSCGDSASARGASAMCDPTSSARLWSVTSSTRRPGAPPHPADTGRIRIRGLRRVPAPSGRSGYLGTPAADGLADARPAGRRSSPGWHLVPWCHREADLSARGGTAAAETGQAGIRPGWASASISARSWGSTKPAAIAASVDFA